ncbi:MAG: thioredoxin family protein [Bacillota bacterium]|nr:thioredoxin family protein [Bacillota bacterium]
MKKVEVLGPGCVKCQRLAANVKQAAEESGIDVDMVKVEDMMDILAKGCQRTPGIIVDGDLKLQGRIATVDEIKQWIAG